METNRSVMVMGERITLLARGAETQNMLSSFEIVTPPGGGPPPHSHQHEDEQFFVLDGTFEITVGDKTTIAPAGTSEFGPRHVPHWYKNVGDGPARLLVNYLPAGLEDFFVEMSQLPQDGPPDFGRIVAIMQKHGLDIAMPPA